MVGYVIAMDSTGKNEDHSGVRISIDGTSYSTVSDSKGRWELHDVLPGTYNISFTKDKFAMEKIIAYRFVGNGTDYLFSQKIYQIMWTRATLVLRPFDSGKAIFSCRLFRQDSSQSLGGAAMLLIGKNQFLSPEKPESFSYELDNFSDIIVKGIIPDINIGYSFQIDSSYLYQLGFHSNDTIYSEAFASNLAILLDYDILTYKYTYGPSYIDIATNKRIFTGFGYNHSEVKSFILP